MVRFSSPAFDVSTTEPLASEGDDTSDLAGFSADAYLCGP
jgi:hypothetical protein